MSTSPPQKTQNKTCEAGGLHGGGLDGVSREGIGAQCLLPLPRKIRTRLTRRWDCMRVIWMVSAGKGLVLNVYFPSPENTEQDLRGGGAAWGWFGWCQQGRDWCSMSTAPPQKNQNKTYEAVGLHEGDLDGVSREGIGAQCLLPLP